MSPFSAVIEASEESQMSHHSILPSKASSESVIPPLHLATQVAVISDGRQHGHTDVNIMVTTLAQIDQDKQLTQGIVVLWTK